jgi:hypothetical protein
MEFGKASIMILILENGVLLKLTVMESTHGQMETGMKVNGRCVWNMDKEPILFKMEIHTQENTSMVSHMEKVNTFGVQAKIM